MSSRFLLCFPEKNLQPGQEKTPIEQLFGLELRFNKNNSHHSALTRVYSVTTSENGRFNNYSKVPQFHSVISVYFEFLGKKKTFFK